LETKHNLLFEGLLPNTEYLNNKNIKPSERDYTHITQNIFVISLSAECKLLKTQASVDSAGVGMQ